MNEYKVKREKVFDSGDFKCNVKREPKWETTNCVDVKPNIAKIKREPQSDVREPKNIKVETQCVKVEQTESGSVTRPKPVKSRTKKTKPTKRKRKPAKRKPATKTKKRRKTKTKRKPQTSAEQNGIRNARLQLAQRIGIECKKGLPTAILNKQRRNASNDAKYDAGIGNLSITGAGLNVSSTLDLHVDANSFQRNVALGNSLSEWFKQSTASSLPDTLNSIIQKQSMFLSKKRNYEIEKDGRVNYISGDAANSSSRNVEINSCHVSQKRKSEVDKKPEIKQFKLKKFENPTHSNNSIQMKQEYCSSTCLPAETTNEVFSNGVTIKNESSESLLFDRHVIDVEIVEVKKEKPKIPVISLDSPKMEDTIKPEEQLWVERVKLEIKSLLKPYLRNSEINDDEYDEILKKSVPKVAKHAHNLNIVKLNQMIVEYVKKMKRLRLKTERS